MDLNYIGNIVKKAQQMVYIMQNMDDTVSHREIANKLRYHWSITYIPKSNTFHLYLEDSKLCYNIKFVDIYNDEYDYRDGNGNALKIKRATSAYKEGVSSIILAFSDYAKGPVYSKNRTNWNLDKLIEFNNTYGQDPYFYF